MDTVAGATKRVLVVDDEPDICAYLKEVLESAGIQVDTAMTAEDALELFGLHTYDLLTLDCFMPGTSGVALHQTLSHVYGFGKRLPSTMPQRLPPVLVITGYTQDASVREMVFGERIVGMLQKPVISQELLRVVSEVLGWEETRNTRRTRALTRLGQRISKPN
jgi:CheY-like chemotaxis protein